jgi:quinol monooxygenase YgiN
MSTEISWHVELAVKPGKLEDFRTLTREMVEATRSEPGTLIYERFVSEDGTVVYGYERYVDSAAAVAHLVAFGTTYRDRFMATVERKRFTVFGVPSAELRGLLDAFGATYHTPLEGVSRATEGKKD